MLNLKATNPATIAEAGYEFKVVLPDSTPTEAKIKVRGESSPVVRAFFRKVYQDQQIRENAAKRKGKEADPMSIEEAEEFAAKAAAIRIISWTGMTEDGKNEVPYSKETAERLMAEYPYLRDLVIGESNDVSNFRLG